MALSDEAAAEQTAAELRKTIDHLQRRLAIEKERTEAVVGAVYEAVHDSLRALDIPPVKPPKKDRRTKGEETAVLMLSDWQLGKKTPSYSSEVCEERIALLREIGRAHV